MLRQTKLAAYSTYAIGGVLPKDLYPHALFWDTADPYLYIRIFPLETHDVAIIGGEDHKTGQGDPEASYKRLRQKAESVLPKAVWKWRWSGQVIETPDGLPYMGEAQPHEFLATGFAGNGMTFGTLAAMMARDWALELRNPWIDLFSVNRKKLATAWDYLAENKDYPFYLAKGSLDSAERAEPESVAPGEGRVVRSHGKKVAVHRDSDGHLHVHSAICPHLGCVVKWNAAEKTWDCPCHGSRFQATGEVIAGPAESPLAPAAEPAATHA
jgi:Rieske Fe-S protein